MLPGFDGFEVVEAIRRDPGRKRPRIVMLTAKGHEKDRRKARELGVDDYVTKPFSNRDVVERVQALSVAGGTRPMNEQSGGGQTGRASRRAGAGADGRDAHPPDAADPDAFSTCR